MTRSVCVEAMICTETCGGMWGQGVETLLVARLFDVFGKFYVIFVGGVTPAHPSVSLKNLRICVFLFFVSSHENNVSKGKSKSVGFAA